MHGEPNFVAGSSPIHAGICRGGCEKEKQGEKMFLIKTFLYI